MTEILSLRTFRPLGWSWQGQFHPFTRSSMDIHADIDNRLSYHPVTDETKPVFEENRADFLALAHRVADRVPPGRHQSLALTALQEALMWSNAAIACDTP